MKEAPNALIAKQWKDILRVSPDVSDKTFLKMLPVPPQRYEGVTHGRDTARNKETKEKELVKALKVALAWSEDVWGEEFAEYGLAYEPPTLVLYTGSIDFAYGKIDSKDGPKYSPADRKLYIDPDFFKTMQKNYWGLTNEAIAAHVIFHEVSHHVQNLMGIHEQYFKLLGEARPQTNPVNVIQMGYELQAEYLSGVALHALNEKRNIFHSDDPENIFWSLVSMGDDFHNLRSGNIRNPDTYTHGTGKQRANFFWAGLTAKDTRGKYHLRHFIEAARQR